MSKDIKVSPKWAIKKGFELVNYEYEGISSYYIYRLSKAVFYDLSIIMEKDEETNEWECRLFPYDDFVFTNVIEVEQLIKLLTKNN